ncbi:MAG: ABC transporter ATP-binding protein [Rhodobiaceae bacterium]|nr:ABC transporter ATP-binding protein [Rhodobiaceae bacterium]MCC0018656.1 ABC transporter ATP-binding protein [Rhodobiaceae bacterium]MCC0051004.1 ABC transporter ATP-binding protein [Rhodobiaceae bacterium]MCC0060363.1 ABC transporter ATP-binding protein [Rhodobiaceae bacterium]
MLAALDVVKDFTTSAGTRRVLDGISFSISKGEKLAVLGRNGSGKTTLIQILAGVERLTSGYIHRGLKLSWPLGFSGGFEGELTGYDNIRFICKIYGADLEYVVDYVADFSELGNLLHTPVKTYSSGMRARLAFALSIAIDFECYLIDEVVLVGDKRFKERCEEALFEKKSNKAMLLAIHSMEFVKNYCSGALVLKDGRGRVFYDTDLACKIYASL